MEAARKLTLRKETLVELTHGELRGIVGGCTDGLTCVPPTLTDCPDFYCTGTC
jgi:hypothetical protein